MNGAFSSRRQTWEAVLRLLGVVLLAPGLAGCVAAAMDVRDYYRQMQTNYKEAKEKAKLDALSLEGESKVLAATGDFSSYRRKQRALERAKSWEARCGTQEERFQKAANWTEEHFNLKSTAAPQTAIPAAQERGATVTGDESRRTSPDQ